MIAVVGASSGIGRATAARLAARGEDVVMLSRSRAKLEEAGKTIRARLIAMDMLDAATTSATIGGLGPIEHLVLTAVADELASKEKIHALTNEQVERTFDKLRGFVNVIRAANVTGTVTLLTGASAARPPREGFSVLAAASASILGFGKALALELAPVRVNVVMSGVVDTAIHAANRDGIKAWAERELPVKRFGDPDDIARAIEMLIDNPYVTASTLTVDGGFTAL